MIHGTSRTVTSPSTRVTQRGTRKRRGSSGMNTLYPGRVTLRSFTAERLLAWSAAVVGVIGIVSASTPEMADRVRIVRGVLPPGWPEAARVLTVAGGIGLIWLS